MKAAYYAGLQTLALALIFMPEPVTTVVGVGLLNYARLANRRQPNRKHRLISTFEDHYNYKMNLINGTVINYQLSPRRYGQLPKSYPNMAKLLDNHYVLRTLRERAQRHFPTNSTTFSRLEPAGLMKAPRREGLVRCFPPKPPSTYR